LVPKLFLTRKLKAAADPRAVFRELDAAAQDRRPECSAATTQLHGEATNANG
jgi:hypothetical protein